MEGVMEMLGIILTEGSWLMLGAMPTHWSVGNTRGAPILQVDIYEVPPLPEQNPGTAAAIPGELQTGIPISVTQYRPPLSTHALHPRNRNSWKGVAIKAITVGWT